jgi:23S rRNA pseudoU1915 N3-methylase RlmH
VLDKQYKVWYNTDRKGEENKINSQRKEIKIMNKYNLNRIERHYMTEVMLTFQDKHGREMTAEEFAAEVEKMRNRKA